jgi:hypothetical protein
MGHIYLNFNKSTLDTPWVVSETNEDRTTLYSQKLATDLEINVHCKTFVGKFHYFYCQGIVTLDGTKAIINKENK